MVNCYTVDHKLVVSTEKLKKRVVWGMPEERKVAQGLWMDAVGQVFTRVYLNYRGGCVLVIKVLAIVEYECVWWMMS